MVPVPCELIFDYKYFLVEPNTSRRRCKLCRTSSRDLDCFLPGIKLSSKEETQLQPASGRIPHRLHESFQPLRNVSQSKNRKIYPDTFSSENIALI